MRAGGQGGLEVTIHDYRQQPKSGHIHLFSLWNAGIRIRDTVTAVCRSTIELPTYTVHSITFVLYHISIFTLPLLLLKLHTITVELSHIPSQITV